MSLVVHDNKNYFVLHTWFLANLKNVFQKFVVWHLFDNSIKFAEHKYEDNSIVLEIHI